MHILLNLFKGLTYDVSIDVNQKLMQNFLKKCSMTIQDKKPYLLLYTTKKCTLWQERNYLLGQKVFGKFLAKNLAEAVLVPFEATPPN